MPPTSTHAPAIVCLLATAFFAAGVNASEQQTCTIEYEVHNVPDPAGNVDTDPEHKEFNVCVRNLEDCTTRALSLARAHEQADFSEDVPTKPDLGSIRIVTTRTEDGCEAPE